MVFYNNGETMYNVVLALITENLKRLANEIIYPAFPSTLYADPDTKRQEYEELVEALTKVWNDHHRSMLILHHLLKPLVRLLYIYPSFPVLITHAPQDQYYTKAANVPELTEAGRNLFLEHIIRPPIIDHVISAILGLIRIERYGHAINRSAAKDCVVLLRMIRHNDTVSVYERDLEPIILKTTEEYYRGRIEAFLYQTCDAPECMRMVRCPSE